MDNAIYGQLTVFQTIASEGSISAAARKLGIAVPSASQSLKLLEQKIGVPLFVRTTRQIQLTEAGTQLLERTQDALSTLQQAVDDVQQFGQTPCGLVRITLSRFAYQLILKPIFAEFCTLYPQVQLELSIHDGTIDILEQGYDLGIRFGNTLQEGWIARQLLPSFKEGLYATQSYLDRYGIPQSPTELPHHQLIGYRFITSGKHYPLILQYNGQDLTINMQEPIICNDIEVMNDAIHAGIAIGRIFEPIRNLHPNATDFIPILESYWKSYPALYLYYLQHSQRAKRIQVFIDFVNGKNTSPY